MTGRRIGDAVVDVLEAAGVKVVFGIPGIQTMALYDALADRPGIRHVLPRHEQGAAFAADGYARVSRSPGVCSTTTGPGTFNTLAAVAEAWSDSSPVVILAGQIDAALDGQGRGVLHETPDQGRSFEALTAYVGRPREPEQIPGAVAEALRRSMSGRWRPAYVELPTDLVGLPVLDGRLPEVAIPPPVAPEGAEIAAAARLIATARRPLILAGAGVQRAGAAPVLAALARRLAAPVATSLTGAGAIRADDPLWAGPVVADRPETRRLFEEADHVLVIGSRLDDVGTGRWTLPMPGLIQVDVDPAAVGRSYQVSAGVVGDARLALQSLLDELGDGGARTADGWGDERARGARESLLNGVPPARRPIRDAFLAARAALPRDAILTHDAARLNSWTGFFWPVYEPDGSIWPWGSATLGFALPVANGAAIAAPGRRVVAACGDGGFMFTATELATAVAHSLDVTVLLHDDAGFGSIAEYQRRAHGRAYATDLVNPDFVAFARSFGVPAVRVDDVGELPAALARVTAEPGPSVVVLSCPLGHVWD